MKKEHISHKTGSFKDFKGQEHFITVVAISEVLPKIYDDDNNIYYEVVTWTGDDEEEYIGDLTKTLKLGYCICNPEDKYDELTGIKKATARARKSKPVIWASDNSMINSEIVEAYMNSIIRYISNAPERYIPGYDKARDKFNYKENLKKSFDFMEDVDKNICKTLTYLDDTKLNKMLEIRKNLNV